MQSLRFELRRRKALRIAATYAAGRVPLQAATLASPLFGRSGPVTLRAESLL